MSIGIWGVDRDTALLRHMGEQPEHLAMIEATAHLIVATAKPGRSCYVECVENALPEDAEVYCIRTHPTEWETVLIVLRSRAFVPVGPGDEIPLLPAPVYRDLEAWEAVRGRMAGKVEAR